MHKSFEAIQRTIIIYALVFGVVVSSGGIAYKFLSVNHEKNSPVQAVPPQSVTTPVTDDNLYAKLKASLPVNIVVFGNNAAGTQEFLEQSKNNLEANFQTKVNLSLITNYQGTCWSTLMSLNKFKETSSLKPDLILFCLGLNDQQELRADQSQKIYETILQTAGQKYPQSELILLQASNITAEVRESQKKLASHYSLPLLTLPDETNAQTTEPAAEFLSLINNKLKSTFSGNNIAKTSPLSDLGQYQSWQRVENFSSSYLMEKADVPDKAPRLVSSKSGAYVESNFTGSAVGVLVKCVPDGGMARVYVDGKKYGLIDTYSPQSMMRFVLVADDLQPGEHRVKLIVLGQGKYPSQGKRVIWYGFDATGPKN